MSTQENDSRSAMGKDDVRDLKRQLDKLTGAVGELVVAFKGNDLGTQGMVARVHEIEEQQRALKNRLDELELATKRKEMYVMAIIGLAGIVIGSLIKTLFDHLLPVKK